GRVGHQSAHGAAVRSGREGGRRPRRLSRHIALHAAENNRREPVSPSVTRRQLGDLPNMIQPPLLGVVNAASAVSARTVTCRAPAVPRSCSMLSVYVAVRVRPFPKLPPSSRTGAVARP